MIVKRIDRYFQDYSHHHQTTGNQVCHWLGIPMIIVTLLGLLSGLIVYGDSSATLRLDGGIILLIIATLWYLILDWKLAIPFSLVALGMYFLGRTLPTPVQWIVFVAGWVFQFIGHYRYEKKSPAFFKNLEHVLVGPLWLFSKAVKYRSANEP